ncbi:hypothetical protein [Methanocella sp. MCL-LM]|uniref:hypothetical protein n=1 Tax=Methanocella sp. MCL-LM TaxID=3412035 RepID=UPI003C752C03
MTPTKAIKPGTSQSDGEVLSTVTGIASVATVVLGTIVATGVEVAIISSGMLVGLGTGVGDGTSVTLTSPGMLSGGPYSTGPASGCGVACGVGAAVGCSDCDGRIAGTDGTDGIAAGMPGGREMLGNASMLELTFSPVRAMRSRQAATRPDKVTRVAVDILDMANLFS